MEQLKTMRSVLELEARALQKAAQNLGEKEVQGLLEVFEYLRVKGGSLLFCGVGKSGIIASKLAATFSSLGLNSTFLHPVEALHGDLGRVKQNDVIVLISKSGTTEELIRLIPFLPMDKNLIIGFLGRIQSPLADKCHIVFDCSIEKEACINNQAPTTSSTLALAMGDAMAVVYEQFIGLSREGFATNHPGGILGKSLRMKVKDLMWSKADSASVSADATLQDVVLAMTKFPVGGCAIVDSQGKMLGILVEGDIRRTFTKPNHGLQTLVKDIMNSSPVTIGPEELASNALNLMEKRQKPISILPVIGEDKEFLGFIRLHDLWREGFSLER